MCQIPKSIQEELLEEEDSTALEPEYATLTQRIGNHPAKRAEEDKLELFRRSSAEEGSTVLVLDCAVDLGRKNLLVEHIDAPALASDH